MGAIFNIFFALFLAFFLWIIGTVVDVRTQTTVIGAIPSSIDCGDGQINNPLSDSGLLPGDEILCIDGAPLRRFIRLPQLIAIGTKHDDDGQPISELTVRRNGDIMALKIPVLRSKEMDNLRHVVLAPAQELRIAKILENSPAKLAGLSVDDRILSMDEYPMFAPEALHEYLQMGKKEVQLCIERGKEHVLIKAYPQKIQRQRAHLRAQWNGQEMILLQDGERWKVLGKFDGNSAVITWDEVEQLFSNIQEIPERTVYALGINFVTPTVLSHRNPFAVIGDGMESTWQILRSIFNRHSEIGPQHLVGAPGIMRILHHLALDNFRHLLIFVIQLNIGLAIVNLLPIPALDGGHILFVLLEKIRRRSLSTSLVNGIQFLFLSLLFAMMIYLGWKDVRRWASDVHAQKVWDQEQHIHVAPKFHSSSPVP
jgi:regulator of sigma E protease